MSLSLSNRDDIIANSFSIITANGSVVDVLDAVQSSIVGLPSSSLNTIESFQLLFRMTLTISKQAKHLLTIKLLFQQRTPKLRLLPLFI